MNAVIAKYAEDIKWAKTIGSRPSKCIVALAAEVERLEGRCAFLASAADAANAIAADNGKKLSAVLAELAAVRSPLLVGPPMGTEVKP